MTRRSWTPAAVLGLLLLPAPALAQLPGAIWGGWVVMAPLSDTADRFTQGYGFGVGASWRILPMIGLRVDYVRAGVEPEARVIRTLAGGSADVSGHLQIGSAAVIVQAPTGPARVYVLAGAGLYRRDVSIAGVPAGGAAVCDPWLFLCGGNPNGTRSTTDVGFNVGVGVLVGPLFVEGRYHFMGGPEFQTPAGVVTATGKYFPLTVGVRF